MMISVIKTLLGLHKDRGGGESISRLNMAITNVVVFQTGKSGQAILVRKKGVSSYESRTRIPFPIGSIGEKIGLKPEFIKVGLPTNDKLTPDLACLIAGTDSLDEAIKAGVITERRDSLSLNPFMKWADEARESMTQRVLAACNMTDGDILPAHPSWVSGEENALYIAVRHPNTLSWKQFCERCGIVNDEGQKKVFIRAGKDIWSTPSAEEKIVKIFVTAEDKCLTKNSHDGNFFIKAGTFGDLTEFLVRGVPVKTEGGRVVVNKSIFCILKGRAIAVDSLPSIAGMTAPEGCDAICSIDNLKWLSNKKSVPGTVQTVKLIPSRDEDNEDKDEYRLNLLSLVMAKMSDRTSRWVKGKFLASINRLTKRLESPDAKILDDLAAILNLEGNSKEMLVLSEMLAKYHLGLMDKSQRHALAIKMAKMAIKSVKIHGAIYASVFFADSWAGKSIGRGEILIGDSPAFDRIGSEYVTGMRYPWVSYQSFMKLRVAGKAAGLHGRFIIMNPEDAVYCQGDGDDHILVIPEQFKTEKGLKQGFESLFSPASGEEPFIARNFADRGYAFSNACLYWKGAVSQGSIGSIFNRMLEVLAAYKDTGLDPSEVYRYFGGALDIAAQGVKKNYELPDLTEISETAERLIKRCQGGHEGEYTAMAAIYLHGDGDWKTAFGENVNVTIPERNILVNRKLTNCGAKMRAKIDEYCTRLSDGNDENKYLANPVYWHVHFVEVLSKNFGGHLYSDTITDDGILAWIDAYAYAAYSMRRNSERKDLDWKVKSALTKRLNVMNPIWVLASQLTEKDVPPSPDGGKEVAIKEEHIFVDNQVGEDVIEGVGYFDQTLTISHSPEIRVGGGQYSHKAYVGLPKATARAFWPIIRKAFIEAKRDYRKITSWAFYEDENVHCDDKSLYDLVWWFRKHHAECEYNSQSGDVTLPWGGVFKLELANKDKPYSGLALSVRQSDSKKPEFRKDKDVLEREMLSHKMVCATPFDGPVYFPTGMTHVAVFAVQDAKMWEYDTMSFPDKHGNIMPICRDLETISEIHVELASSTYLGMVSVDVGNCLSDFYRSTGHDGTFRRIREAVIQQLNLTGNQTSENGEVA